MAVSTSKGKLMAVLPGITASSVNWSQLLKEVYRGRQTYKYREGLNIPLHPHDVWIVCRGVVQLSTFHCDGNEAILGLAYPDMPFGAPITQIDPYEAIGLTDVILMRISQREIEQSPQLMHGMLLQLNRRLQQTEILLDLINHHQVGDRLQHLLLLLKSEVGEVTPDGVRLRIRLTHEQLANLTGTTRPSVTRLFRSLRKQGWLSVDQSRHILLHSSIALQPSPTATQP